MLEGNVISVEPDVVDLKGVGRDWSCAVHGTGEGGRTVAFQGNIGDCLGEQDVATAFKDVEEIDDTDVLGLTRAIWKKFKSWTAFQLSDLTHRPGSPWATVYSRAQYAVIPLELIQEKGFGDGSF